MKHFNQTYILPDSQFRIYWNYVILTSILYFALKIPIFYSFKIVTNGWFIIADSIVTLIFLTDIILIFRSAFYKQGELITDIDVIKAKYLKSWFVPDFIATFPFDMVALYMGYPTLAVHLILLRLFRVPRVYRLFSKISMILSYSSHIRFILFSFWIIVSINICACGWIIINPNDGSVDNITFYNKFQQTFN